VLCVHEGGICGIPHLEWYSDLKNVCEHNPIKVQGFFVKFIFKGL